MTKVFLDTDVLIDYLTDKKPFSDHTEILFQLAGKGELILFVSSLSFSNIYYVIRRKIGSEKALNTIEILSELVEIQTVGKTEIIAAIHSGFSDFEDAIQSYTALRITGLKIILTRNIRGFKKSSLAIFTPEIFLKTLTH